MHMLQCETCRNGRSLEDVGSLCGGPCHAQCQLPGFKRKSPQPGQCSGARHGFGIPFSISVIVVTWKFEKFYRGSSTNFAEGGCHLDRYRKDTLSFRTLENVQQRRI